MRSWRETADGAVKDLREAWIKSGMTQQQVGDLAGGMSQATVSEFLLGRWPDWRISTVVRYASALGYEVAVTITKKPPAERRPEA